MISLLCPTRGRVEMFSRMAGTALEMSPKGVEVIAYVDADDPMRAAYEQIGIARIFIGPRRYMMTEYWNELIPLAQGDIFGQLNDDVVFKTPGWAQMIEKAFAACSDKILMVHGNDEAYGQDHGAAHPFVHRRWTELLGYFIPPYFSSDYGDTWTNEIAERIGRRRYLPFVAEHMHFSLGKSAQDKTTNERLERHKQDNPAQVYQGLVMRRVEDAEKLRAAMNAPKLTIMILTQPSRIDFLKRLMDGLNPQVAERFDVEVLTETYDPYMDLGENRERMRHNAHGEYICFVDDDDRLADDYIAKIMPRLDGVDYIGFKVQTSVDGQNIPVTTHSLKSKGVGANDKGHYRDISHLNPMRRELALACSMSGGFGEDSRWAEKMRGLVKTEHFVDKILYYYESRTNKTDEVKPKMARPVNQMFMGPFPNYAREIRRDCCPSCKNASVAPYPNGWHCLECGFSFN